MRFDDRTLVFRMKLCSDEPFMAGYFYNFRQSGVRIDARL